MSHTWMKYINQEELLKPKPYDGYPRAKLREMLIKKDEFIKDIMENICDHPDYDDTIMETEMNVKETIEKEQIDLRKHYSEVVKHQAEKIQKLEKKVNSQMRVAKSVNAKLQKQIRTMKDDWYGATNKMGEQISNLTKEVENLKQELRKRETNGRATLNSWDRKSQQQLQQIDNQCEELVAKDKIIEYHELREMYLEKYIQEYGCWHQFREMVEETAHKFNNEKHVGILFDD